MSATATDILQSGNTAVITGASSGIGRAAAMHCAGKGMHVWMLDIDKAELEIAENLTKKKAASESQVR